MGAGPMDFQYIDVEEYIRLGLSSRSASELRRMAAAPKIMCEVCGELPAWRLGGCGMCFSCTTGDADASHDYELIPTGGEHRCGEPHEWDKSCANCARRTGRAPHCVDCWRNWPENDDRMDNWLRKDNWTPKDTGGES